MILLSLLLKTYTCQDFTKDGLDVVPFVDRFILSVHVWSPCPVRFAEKISRNTVPANLLWEKNIIPAEKNKLKKTNYKRSEHGPCAVKIRFSDCIWWLVQYKGAEQSVQNCTISHRLTCTGAMIHHVPTTWRVMSCREPDHGSTWALLRLQIFTIWTLQHVSFVFDKLCPIMD